MENVTMWETRNVLILSALIGALFALVVWLGGEKFSCAFCEVIQTMLQ
jgi:hypothetical protein